MAEFLIGRQQIFNKNLDIVAYEILFRGKDFDLSNKGQAAQATNQVLTDSLLELGIDRLVDNHKAFFNFTAQNILEKIPHTLPKDRIVIEVLEDVTIDLRIINNIRELSELGYTIALDDFVFSDAWLPLIEIANIIKLDVLLMDQATLVKTLEQLKPYPVQLLAEKVETYQQFEQLLALGCEYFQGYFLSKPNVVKGRRLSINQAAAIKLLGLINKADIDFAALTQVISQDVGLTFKLLRYINSAFFALPNKIESIRHAIACLGLIEIKRWATIVTLSTLGNKPTAVLQNALIRAKMCELIAEQMGYEPEHYFLIGILSSLDSLLDMPLENAIAQLPLSNDIPLAVLQYEGLAGEILAYVLKHEQWQVSEGSFKTLSSQRITDIYLQSIEWTRNALGQLI